MHRRLTRYSVLLAFTCLLGACGFHLRGTGVGGAALPEAWKNMFMATGNPNSEFSRDVAARFAANGVSFAQTLHLEDVIESVHRHYPPLLAAIAETDVRLLVIPEKTVQLILERNARLREVLEERIRAVDRELHRQQKLAERRKRPVLLDLHSKPELGERLIRRFALVEQADDIE